jgi:hypothetical protein
MVAVSDASHRVVADDGETYTVRVYAEADALASWSGWLEFRPASGHGRVWRTGFETSQQSADAVAYWASGLGVHYLRGALRRAREQAGRAPRDTPVLVKDHATRIAHADGSVYRVRTWACEERSGTWVAWLEFRRQSEELPSLRTGHETSQPSLQAVEYWANGLRPVYFEGALARARP